MGTTDSIEPLLKYHRAFCELVGTDPNDLRFHKSDSKHYWELHREGFSVAEMIMVVKLAIAQNKKASDIQYRRRIDPLHILGDLDRFCSDLREAKRLAALKVSPRQQAVNEFRGFKSDVVRDSAVSLRDVLRKAVDAPDARL